jgi:hypothetical protein
VKYRGGNGTSLRRRIERLEKICHIEDEANTVMWEEFLFCYENRERYENPAPGIIVPPSYKRIARILRKLPSQRATDRDRGSNQNGNP